MEEMVMTMQQAGQGTGSSRERVIEGGVATWACVPGFPPAVIFPFTPAERYGLRNCQEFQMLMYRPLYWLGRNGRPEIDYDLSIGEEPEWDSGGRVCVVRIKPWKWSNGETVCADNVMFWMNMMSRKGPLFGGYVEGYFPDNLVSYDKVADDQVRFTFDRAYSRAWILMNQLTLITPMPRAWDRTAAGPADATRDPGQVDAVYEFLMAENGDAVAEDNTHRITWPESPVWSVVNGPWRLQSYTREGAVTFIPNEHYSGPVKPRLAEFREMPIESDGQEFELLRAGPDGPDAIQVGFLPLNYIGVPGEDGAPGGPNPVSARYRLVPQFTLTVNFMALNFSNPTVAGNLIRQAYVRQALQSCLDQDYVVREIYHGYGRRQAGPIPMGWGDLVSPRLADGRGPWPFDVERARELLASNGWDVSVCPAVCVRPGTGPGQAGAGIPAGTRLSLSVRYWAGREVLDRLMRQFETDAAKAGIELRRSEVVGSVLAAEDGPGKSTPERPRLWELSCWGGGWGFNYPTGENLFQSGAACNFSNYEDPRADEFIARTVTSDEAGPLHEYQDYISEQVPVIFMPAFPRRLHEIAANLGGFTPANPYGLINPENWYYFEEGSSR
jgi:peptide/nickel transport system substrate-binding protein